MNKARQLAIGSLFTGVLGLDLAVEAVTGGRLAWCAETDPYAAHVIARRAPGIPNLGDVTKISQPPAVDVLCGGFPCQDISLAGSGEGLDGERSGLWWEFRRLIREVVPRFVFVENVAALRSRGLDAVLGSMAGLGFDAEWGSIAAADVGAPHRRRRLFILAYRDRDDLRQLAERNERLEAERRHGEPVDAGEHLADADEAGRASGSATGGPRRGHAAAEGSRVHLADADRERGRERRHVSTGESDAQRTRQELADAVHYGRVGRETHHSDGRDASWHDPHGRDQGVVYPPPPDDGEGWARWVGAGGPVPGVRRSAYGPSTGVDARRRRGRLRCLGNGAAPRQAAAAFLILIARGARSHVAEGS